MSVIIILIRASSSTRNAERLSGRMVVMRMRESYTGVFNILMIEEAR
jgi:hypothetical protein